MRNHEAVVMATGLSLIIITLGVLGAIFPQGLM